MAAANKKGKQSSDCINKAENSIEIGSRCDIGPIVRRNYQKQAFHAITSSEQNDAVLIDSKVPSCTYVRTYFNYDRYSPTIDEQAIGQTINMQQKSDNELMSYLTACFNKVEINDNSCDGNSLADDDKAQINDLYAKCAELPSQWNIVQLNQMYDGHNGYSTNKDILTSDAPIKFTLFRYNRWDKRENIPFNIVLDFKEFGPESVSILFEINSFEIFK